MKSFLKFFGIGVGIILIIGAILISINFEKLLRLYLVVTLFDEDNIVENFSNMKALGMPTLDIKKAAPIFEFRDNPKALPEVYEYKGEKRSVAELLERTRTTALLVIKNDSITFENYYLGTTKNDLRISWSVAKSFLSAIFGVAVQDGHIRDIKEPVTKYVPELKGSGYEGVAIKDVLQMSSGVRFNEDSIDFNSDINRMGRILALGGSFDEFAGTLVSERTPGTYLHYVSVDTHVLGMVLRHSTGRKFDDYFYDKLWSIIGSGASIYYITDTKEEPMIMGGLNMRTRDYARFGRLYLENGKWNGVQIIPSEWVTASITPDAPHLYPGERPTSDLNMGYGYQWWIPENADQEFLALGIYDQFIYINQKAGVVIVKNSANLNFTENNFESFTETTEAFRAIVTSFSE